MRTEQHYDHALQYISMHPEGYSPAGKYPLVILLHWFGANMGDLVPLAPAINSTDYLYVFPNAPHSLNRTYGSTGFAWASFPPKNYDSLLSKSIELLDLLIDGIICSLDILPSQVVLAGFSQGGMMALINGLQPNRHFGGLAVLSGKSPGFNPDMADYTNTAHTTSIFVSHGTNDTVIPVSEARNLRDLLTQHNHDVLYHEYAMDHEIHDEEIRDLKTWLSSVISTP